MIVFFQRFVSSMIYNSYFVILYMLTTRHKNMLEVTFSQQKKKKNVYGKLPTDFFKHPSTFKIRRSLSENPSLPQTPRDSNKGERRRFSSIGGIRKTIKLDLISEN